MGSPAGRGSRELARLLCLLWLSRIRAAQILDRRTYYRFVVSTFLSKPEREQFAREGERNNATLYGYSLQCGGIDR